MALSRGRHVPSNKQSATLVGTPVPPISKSTTDLPVKLTRGWHTVDFEDRHISH